VAGDDKDWVFAGTGNDTIYGGQGSDYILADSFMSENTEGTLFHPNYVGRYLGKGDAFIFELKESCYAR